MNILEGNSHKAREEKARTEERRKLSKVVNGTVKEKKKSTVAKFFGNFISEEDISSIKSYVFKDVIVPTVKKAIVETVNAFVWGKSSGGRTNASKVSYRSYYDRNYDEPRSHSLSPARSSFNYDDIVFDSRGEAELVLTTLDDMIAEYGSARVADLYDAVGLSCDYTANDYGWKNLSTAEVIRYRDGYSLKMPRPTPIR